MDGKIIIDYLLSDPHDQQCKRSDKWRDKKLLETGRKRHYFNILCYCPNCKKVFKEYCIHKRETMYMGSWFPKPDIVRICPKCKKKLGIKIKGGK
ncbi:MAG: hypothetical protein ACTSWL_10410 [Promethearchaeota archaeon]